MVHCDEALHLAAVPPAERRAWRHGWYRRAMSDHSACDLAFADPDNGMVDNADHRRGKAVFRKQIPLDEVRSLAKGRCAVIYHHNTRRAGGHDAEVDHWLSEIGLPGLGVRAKAFSPRTFFVLNPSKTIAERLRAFCHHWRDLNVHLHVPGGA